MNLLLRDRLPLWRNRPLAGFGKAGAEALREVGGGGRIAIGEVVSLLGVRCQIEQLHAVVGGGEDQLAPTRDECLQVDGASGRKVSDTTGSSAKAAGGEATKGRSDLPDRATESGMRSHSRIVGSRSM